ncbi:uncharacterized protein LOC128668369 [Microplitis demolitor]|uniref:uncharacterized protein LOC128668369 n=1 Tax=Microplitis demolitor TaxID=69319 RepID=UPI00235B6A4C|nr:uncharacterized protein LOC128668369 [Microplitis demolitor]
MELCPEDMDLNVILDNYILRDQEKSIVKDKLSAMKLKISNVLPACYRRPLGEKRYFLPIEKPNLREYPKLKNDKGEFILNLILTPLPLNVTQAEIEYLLRNTRVSYESVRVIKRHKRAMAFVKVKNLRASLRFQLNGRECVYILRNSFIARVIPAHIQTESSTLTPVIGRLNDEDKFSTIPEPAFSKIVNYLEFKDQVSLMLTSKFLTDKIWKVKKNLEVIANNHKNTQCIPFYVLQYYLSPFNAGLMYYFEKILLSDPIQCQQLNMDLSPLIIPKYKNCSTLTELDLSAVKISSMAIEDLKNFSNLTSLKIGATTGSCDYQIKSLFKYTSTKNTLITFGVYNNIYFCGSSLASSTALNIKNLFLVYCLKLHLREIQKFITSCKTLDVLRIERCSHVDNTHCFSQLFQNLENSELKRIELINSSTHVHHYFGFQFPYWENPAINLKHLSITGFDRIDPGVIDVIIKNCPILEELNIIDFDLQKYSIEFSLANNLKSISLVNVININKDFWKTKMPAVELACFRLKHISCNDISLFIKENADSLVEINVLENSLYNLAMLSDMEAQENLYTWKNPVKVIVANKFIYKLQKSRSYLYKNIFPVNPLVKFVNKSSLYQELKLSPKTLIEYKRFYP